MSTTEVLKQTLELFSAGDEFAASAAESFLDALIAETDELILTKTFHAWNEKGITENEIYQLASIMRDRCTKVLSKHERFADIVGTGGSKVKTFNVSTAAAFVIAGQGIPVAKHGNKAATSSTGSADVLSALGIEPSVDAATAERCLNEIGICFMYAPNFHRLSPTLANVRRGLGFPTIFNCIGPLCNPADAPHRLIGVWDRSLLSKMAGALARLGTKKSWIVHGEDGSDEISVSGPTFVAEVENGKIREFEVVPEDFCISPTSANRIRVKTPEESALIVREVLEFKRKEATEESLVLVNAAAAFYLANGTTLSDGFASGVDTIRNGNAARKLDDLASAVSL